MKVKVSAAERLVRAMFAEWGGYAKWSICSGCGERRYCRGRTPREVVCVECWEHSPEGRRFLR